MEIILNMPFYQIYIIYTLALGLLVLAVVPREEIKRLSYPAIIYGPITDFFIILTATHLMGIGGYKNYYPFGFMGIPFFPLFSWAAYYILFLYFLPEKRLRKIIYTLAAAAYSTLFSNVLQNLGIFQWNVNRVFLPYILYLMWCSTVAFTYVRYFISK